MLSVRGLREEVFETRSPRVDVRRPGRNKSPHQNASRHHEVEGPWLLLDNSCSIFFLSMPARAPD